MAPASRLPWLRLGAAAGLACLAGMLGAPPAEAAPLYANFDPLATTADYSTTQSAALAGSCANPACSWINVSSASFQFRATASGRAAWAYLPMRANSSVTGAERIFGLTLSDSDGEVVARGGFYGRDAPLGSLQVYEIELFASLGAGQPVANGVLDADAPELVAGQLYTVSFAQTYGSMSSSEWMKSDVAPTAGQAQMHCATNTGGYCAYFDFGLNGWVYPHGFSFTREITDFLPALAITDAQRFAAPPGAGTLPLPGSAGLLLSALALLGGACARRTR